MSRSRHNTSLRAAGTLAAFVLGTSVTAAGCLNRPLEPADTRTTATFTDKLLNSRVDKIDLVLMIDNSGSMADKQAILAEAVPDLVKGLVNPRCLDEAGKPAETQPAGPLDPCPDKTTREFEPVYDIHIGILSSSLGGHGAKTCKPTDDNPSQDDHGHLIARLSPEGGASVPTWKDKGFLAWDPKQKLDPPGENVVGEIDDTSGIVPSLRDMVKGVGQIGCGYEATMESWYRFLVDPEPYKTLERQGKVVVPSDIDNDLLQQRADFLRPDSMVAILLLSDENDCSIKEYGQYYLAAELSGGFHLPRARQECAKDVNDPCCTMCGNESAECPPDPKCSEPMTDEEDPQNLRCFDQKKRYGIDFLYPLERYTQAITSAKVPNRAGELVDNPLFPTAGVDLTTARSPESGLVFLAGIVGVPWQDIARRDAMGKPDLLAGLDEAGRPVGGFKTARELEARDTNGVSGWDLIYGDPANGKAPKDKLMVESREPRQGVTPVTGEALAQPDASSPTANGINGHEWDTKVNPNGDLQYACIFELPTPRNCSDPNENCDCMPTNPLCQSEDGSYQEAFQYRAKAYPGLRELGVLKGIGEQGIVASVCPAQLSNAARTDYGYRPAIGAIIDRLKSKLGGPCLPRQLHADDKGQVQCLVIEARKTDDGACSCDLEARQDVLAEHRPAVDEAMKNPSAATAGWNCFCEIQQVAGDALHACQYSASGSPEGADGWCYIDATTNPAIGEPKLVSNCAATEQRTIRFVGAGNPLQNATTFITCAGD